MDRSNLKNQYDTRYLANRMARTIGHVKLVRSMVESGEDCTDVLVQLAAVRGQLDSICGYIMGQYAEQYAEEFRKTGDEKLVEQFKNDLARVMKG